MLEGWYCRGMHEQARQQEMDSFNTEPDLENDSTEDDSDDEDSGKREVDYKSLYHDLKKKLKILLYVSTPGSGDHTRRFRSDVPSACRRTFTSKTTCAPTRGDC